MSLEKTGKKEAQRVAELAATRAHAAKVGSAADFAGVFLHIRTRSRAIQRTPSPPTVTKTRIRSMNSWRCRYLPVVIL